MTITSKELREYARVQVACESTMLVPLRTREGSLMMDSQDSVRTPKAPAGLGGPSGGE